MPSLRCVCLAMGLFLATTGAAHAMVINIDATLSGCTPCNGSPHPAVGDILTSIIYPTQLTLGPGTYTVTNGIASVGANPSYSAWRWNGDLGYNWTWSFVIANDANKKVLMDGCCPSVSFPTQSAAALDSFGQNFSQVFTLAQQTTLDFVIEDYYPPDNAGGVALLITPEPSTALLVFLGIAGFSAWRSRRRAGRFGAS